MLRLDRRRPQAAGRSGVCPAIYAEKDHWSAVNVRRANDLIAQKRMTRGRSAGVRAARSSCDRQEQFRTRSAKLHARAAESLPIQCRGVEVLPVPAARLSPSHDLLGRQCKEGSDACPETGEADNDQLPDAGWASPFNRDGPLVGRSDVPETGIQAARLQPTRFHREVALGDVLS